MDRQMWDNLGLMIWVVNILAGPFKYLNKFLWIHWVTETEFWLSCVVANNTWDRSVRNSVWKAFMQRSVMSWALLRLSLLYQEDDFQLKGPAEAVKAELLACVRLHPEACVRAQRMAGSCAKRYYCCWHVALAPCRFLYFIPLFLLQTSLLPQ